MSERWVTIKTSGLFDRDVSYLLSEKVIDYVPAGEIHELIPQAQSEDALAAKAVYSPNVTFRHVIPLKQIKSARLTELL